MHLAKRSQPRLKLYALMPGKKGLRNDDTDMTKRHGSALIMKLYAVKAISTALKSFMGLLIVGTCDKRIDQWASARLECTKGLRFWSKVIPGLIHYKIEEEW